MNKYNELVEIMGYEIESAKNWLQAREYIEEAYKLAWNDTTKNPFLNGCVHQVFMDYVQIYNLEGFDWAIKQLKNRIIDILENA